MLTYQGMFAGRRSKQWTSVEDGLVDTQAYTVGRDEQSTWRPVVTP